MPMWVALEHDPARLLPADTALGAPDRRSATDAPRTSVRSLVRPCRRYRIIGRPTSSGAAPASEFDSTGPETVEATYTLVEALGAMQLQKAAGTDATFVAHGATAW